MAERGSIEDRRLFRPSVLDHGEGILRMLEVIGGQRESSFELPEGSDSSPYVRAV